MVQISGSFVHRFSERIMVAGNVSLATLRQLLSDDHRVFIDLRTEDEARASALTIAEVSSYVRELGLAYYHVPMRCGLRDDRTIATVRDLVCQARGQAVLHCTDGARATAMALIHLGCDEGATLGQCYAHDQAIAARWPRLDALTELWIGYILDHGCGAHAERASSRPRVTQ